MRRHLCLLWGLLLACVGGASVRAETLRIATGELPPYASSDRADQGMSLHIVRQAFAKAGVQVEYVFLPWTRALVETRDGKWDATAAWGRNAERDKGFLVSDNVLTEQWQILYRSDRNFTWSSLQDLAGLRIGVVADYSYTPVFWRMVKDGTLRADVAPDDVSNLNKLLAGRVDVVPLDRNVACDLLGAKFTGEQAHRVRAHPKLFVPDFTTHLMMSEKLPASAKRLEAFNRGLKALRQSGEYGKILQQQPCAADLAQALQGG
ncbi:transporter substrate-binding domain-containing protein [Acidovorax sp. GW101-3H11]|uniref:substrate-binding periplasmic protein n=1 Tax=Acidovorax sp. GW101-3H11 TaxID=1813946 RepID=UPI0009EF0E0A|nr:transporter substrate-binding domain-containing protein [Acidovorax sp. GW101-3H11]